MKLRFMISFWFFLCTGLTFFSCGPIYKTADAPTPPPNASNTHIALDKSKLRTWEWSQISLPGYTWPDATAFGNGLYVDIAFDPNGVRIENGEMKFFLDPKTPAAPSGASSEFNFRSEIRTHPWEIRHPLGTEQWIGWSFTFADDYVIDPTAPITIFQNHPGVEGAFPQIELEIAGRNRPSPAQGGEIQVVNGVENTRFVTDIRPQAGERVDFVVHVIFEQGAEGLLQVWMNGELVYSKAESTVWNRHKWGGNNKWGIYHHSHQGDEMAVNRSVEAGASFVEMNMGTLRLLKRTPAAPNYRKDAYELVQPR